jgi:hypothetical protein
LHQPNDHTRVFEQSLPQITRFSQIRAIVLLDANAYREPPDHWSFAIGN